MNDTTIKVLATGGTIAGKAGDALKRDYRPGQIGIDEFLDAAKAFNLGVGFSGVQIANIGSEDIGPEIWRTLHREVLAAFADDSCSGVVITHGTDTIEETAFLLDQTLPCKKPVVLVGAMRPADAVGYDGYRNFANAVRAASDPDALGRGVLVVMSDRIYAARDVRKVRTEGTDAFRGFPRDAIAMVTPRHLEWFGAPWRSGEGARLTWRDALPDVPLISVYAGMEPAALARQLPSDVRGLVIAGVGSGNMPEHARITLAARAAEGCLVIRASRVDEGLVEREPEDDHYGFIAARALTPQKARILVQLLLVNGIADRALVQAEFDRR